MDEEGVDAMVAEKILLLAENLNIVIIAQDEADMCSLRDAKHIHANLLSQHRKGYPEDSKARGAEGGKARGAEVQPKDEVRAKAQKVKKKVLRRAYGVRHRKVAIGYRSEPKRSCNIKYVAFYRTGIGYTECSVYTEFSVYTECSVYTGCSVYTECSVYTRRLRRLPLPRTSPCRRNGPRGPPRLRLSRWL
ncbi:unnamed protein product [Lampetra fluviatilis]